MQGVGITGVCVHAWITPMCGQWTGLASSGERARCAPMPPPRDGLCGACSRATHPPRQLTPPTPGLPPSSLSPASFPSSPSHPRPHPPAPLTCGTANWSMHLRIRSSTAAPPTSPNLASSPRKRALRTRAPRSTPPTPLPPPPPPRCALRCSSIALKSSSNSAAAMAATCDLMVGKAADSTAARRAYSGGAEAAGGGEETTRMSRRRQSRRPEGGEGGGDAFEGGLRRGEWLWWRWRASVTLAWRHLPFTCRAPNQPRIPSLPPSPPNDFPRRFPAPPFTHLECTARTRAHQSPLWTHTPAAVQASRRTRSSPQPRSAHSERRRVWRVRARRAWRGGRRGGREAAGRRRPRLRRQSLGRGKVEGVF